jgi:hypothetical protein
MAEIGPKGVDPVIVGKWRLPTGRNYRWKSWGISDRDELKGGLDGALINTDGVKWKFHCDKYDPSIVLRADVHT